MRNIKAILVLMMTAFSSNAGRSEQRGTCMEGAKNQAEMNTCANQEAAQSDADLNRIYATLVSRAKDDPLASGKIKAAEKAWIVFRDSYLDAMYPAADKQAEYGSIYPMEVDLLRAKLTRQQIDALNELLKQYSK